MLAFLLLAVLSNPDPAVFVKSLYDADRRGVEDPVYGVRTRASIEKIFDKELADLIWRDLVDAMGEVGRMDGHYLYDAQDNEVKNLQVRTVESKGDNARVLATWQWPGGEKGRAEYQLRNTKDGWRIANIVYPNGDYKKYLQADFPEPKIEDESQAQAVCELYKDYKVEVPEGFDELNEAAELAEMYANGDEDTEQDFSAAIHFICGKNVMAPAEQWGMLEHVLKMERGLTDDPLDFCDHATSRDGGIKCAGRRDDEETPDFEARYAAIAKTPALEALKETADAFIDKDAFWEGEQYRGGTMYAYAETHARLDRQKQFITMLEKFTAERAPAASDADVTGADAELNASYKKRIDSIEPCDPEIMNCKPPLEPENLRNAQRAWIAYRDAWIRYYLDHWKGKASPEELRREISVALMHARIEDF